MKSSEELIQARDYDELFSRLMKHIHAGCTFVFVPDIPAWCRERGIPENDPGKPMRFVLEKDCLKLLIREKIAQTALDDRIKEVWIRDQVTNVAHQNADLLDSPEKKLAFVLLDEYAQLLPENRDALQADQWAFEEMRRMGYFEKNALLQ